MHTAKVVASIALAALGIYGLLIEPYWIEVTHHPIPDVGRMVPHDSSSPTNGSSLDSHAERLRIVQLSDLHLHRIGRTEESLIKKVNALQPDLLLLTGDVADRPESLAVLDVFLAKIATKHKFAVLGNWEYWGDVNLQELRTIYQRHGVKLLINECIELADKGRIYQITGLDDFTAGTPDEPRARNQCSQSPEKHAAPSNPPAKKQILMQHSPGYFSERKPNKPPPYWLALSGHTHGGQVRPLGMVLWTPPGSGPFVSGWYMNDGANLFVSRGIGTSVAPIRFGSRPEIAVFDNN